MGTEQVRVKAVEILECFRHTKIDLNDESKNFALDCWTVSKLRYRLLFLISRTGNEEAVSGKENCSEGSGFCAGFWVAMMNVWSYTDEDLKIACWWSGRDQEQFEDLLWELWTMKSDKNSKCWAAIVYIWWRKTVVWLESLIVFKINDQDHFALKESIKCMSRLLLDAVLYAVTDIWLISWSNKNDPFGKVTCLSEKVHSFKSY